MSIVVADTGPIHYLVLIDQISLLHTLFGHIIIPNVVRNEKLAPETPEVVRRWITTPPTWLELAQDSFRLSRPE